MLVDQQLIEQLIENQRSAVRWYRRWAIGLIALGSIVIVGTLLVPASGSEVANEAVKAILGVGGTAMSAFSTFPLKEVRNRKDKISVLLALQGKIETAKTRDRAKVEQLIWKVVEATALA